MKKLIAAAGFVLLAGCVASSPRGSTGFDPMDSDATTYVPGSASSYEPPAAEERLTTSCTMKGKGVECR